MPAFPCRSAPPNCTISPFVSDLMSNWGREGVEIVELGIGDEEPGRTKEEKRVKQNADLDL